MTDAQWAAISSLHAANVLHRDDAIREYLAARDELLRAEAEVREAEVREAEVREAEVAV